MDNPEVGVITNETAQPVQTGPAGNQDKPKRLHFRAKLNEVRTQAREGFEKLRSLFNIESPGQTLEDDEDPSSQVKELALSSQVDPDEYLERSRQALINWSSYKNRLRAETEELTSAMEQDPEGREIDRRLSEIGRIKGLRRIPTIFERRGLSKQKKALEYKRLETESHIRLKNLDAKEMDWYEERVQSKRRELLIDKAVAQGKEIIKSYKDVLDEIHEDGTIAAEIREAYIERVIKPRIEFLREYSDIGEDKIQEYYRLLDETIAARGKNDKGDESPRVRLQTLIDRGGMWGLKDETQVLLDGQDEEIVAVAVGFMAHEDLLNFRWELESSLDEHDSYTVMSRIHRERIRGFVYHSKELEDHIDGGDPLPDMGLWFSFKDSATAQHAFGEEIQKMDDLNYQTILQDSLYSSEKIELLPYYPTPDAIRNLVLLVSADPKHGRTKEANAAIRKLVKRKDWGEILDRAESVYPLLKKGRAKLEKWDLDELGETPDVRDDFSDFAEDVYRNSTEPLVRNLAIEGMRDEAILEVLKEKGILDERTVELFGDTEAFVRYVNGKGSYQLSRSDNWYVADYYYLYRVRSNLIASASEGDEAESSQAQVTLRKLERLSRAILERKENLLEVAYLTNQTVIEKITDPSFDPETLDAFMNAYRKCPEILPKSYENRAMLSMFAKQFTGEETVEFFAKMSAIYRGNENLETILGLVGDGKLSQKRALELRSIAGLMSPEEFLNAARLPEVFLQTDDGVDFLTQASKAGIFSVDPELDFRMGARITELNQSFYPLLSTLGGAEIERVNKLLEAGEPITVDEQNWQQLLFTYIRANNPDLYISNLSEESQKRINEIFRDPKVREYCLSSLRNSWISHLKSGNLGEMPFSLKFMSRYIHYSGAGPLSQIESLDSLIVASDEVFSRKATVARTKEEISQGILKMEERFAKERWSNEDRTDFYNISRDILSAAPSLYSDYLNLFEAMSPAQMKRFAKELLPLYRAKLALLEKGGGDETARIYDNADLVSMRKDIREFTRVFPEGETAVGRQRDKLFGEIKELFKGRFGVTKLPEEFTDEHLRTLANFSTYLSNFSGRNNENEAVLGFYLSCAMNGRWEDFRKGIAVNPDEFLIPEKSMIVRRILERRQKLNPVTAESLGISEEQMPELMNLLEEETQNITVGNIETIDVKLSNIISNLQGLEDPDLYPDPMDKQRLQLLMSWGNKRVGAAVSKMYQSIGGKEVKFSEEEERVRVQITKIMEDAGLQITPDVLKAHFQDAIKPMATVVNLLNFVEETGARGEIESLRNLLKPSEEVIQIFQRLGEDFKPTSGAMALSADLSYLDTLVVKREDELTAAEREIITAYTASIRAEMAKLEAMYEQIKNKFGSLRQSNAGGANELFGAKLAEIDRIINAQNTQQVITSTATTNMNTIIENIRECLSCTNQGANNDTDLTFGDTNKFYLYSQSETQQRGSISDQIVFLEPVVREGGSETMAFVLDRLYGSSTPTVLENQVEVILKKYRAIKSKFPQIKLSVFVTDSAIRSAGETPEMARGKFKAKNLEVVFETAEVDVAESAVEDHYIEFGGGARTAGKRQVGGLLITI